jgi:hypothetical protein
MLKFETKEQLNCLRTIFGISTTIGIRKRHPKVRTEDNVQPLLKINLILGKDTPEDTTSSTRVEFYTNKKESFICLFYNDYILSQHFERLRNTVTNENVIDDEYVRIVLLAEYTNNI